MDVREDVREPTRTGKCSFEEISVHDVGGCELAMRHVAELERQQTGDVEVVDPEERNVVGHSIHGDGYVDRHDEGAAGTVGRVRVIRPLLFRHLHFIN